jgi:hypothetical protein
LRFNSADSAYLTRTFSGTPYTYTLSWWVKRGALSTDQVMFGSRQGASNPSIVEFLSNNTITIVLGVSSTVLTTTSVFRDPSAWYHFVLSVTPSSTSYFYVNGVQVGSWTSSATPYLFNSSYTNAIGRYGDSATLYFNGYMAEVHFIDGQALTPSSFGETDPYTGRWKAKAYSGTYGTNGFYLKFADNSGTTATTLGKDSSSNGNNWTPNNFSVTAGADNDSLVDSPTNYGTDTGLGGEVRGSYATNNPIDNSGGATLSNGNLDVSISGLRSTRSSIAMTRGKWYCEVLVNTVGNTMVGVLNSSASLSQHIGSNANSWGYYHNGNKYTNNVATAFGNTYTNADIIGIAYDADARKVWFSKNGAWQASGDPAAGTNEAYSSITGSEIFFGGSNGGSVSSCSISCNFGQRPFAYAAPSGFKALCTQNLPQPTIQKPSRYMDALAYTGTGASNSISSLGFSPDLVWIKNRGTTTSHAIYDTTRGAQSQLSSDTTGDQVTSSSGLTSFDANGFTIGTSTLVNTSGTQYVAWSWDESVQAGLDIVSYTGNGANRTISHNLGVAPKMIIVKARTTAGADQGWPVYHSGVATDAETDYLLLNSQAIAADLNTVWNDTAPTSSVFHVGTSALVNENNDTYMAYCFAEIDGFSKIGSWIGNGSADGPFLWCGFNPKLIIAKRSSTSTAEWLIFDSARNSFNVSDLSLSPSTNASESTLAYFDFVSNGIKIRSSASGVNGSGQTHIFIAFAESPFKYARAR